MYHLHLGTTPENAHIFHFDVKVQITPHQLGVLIFMLLKNVN